MDKKSKKEKNMHPSLKRGCFCQPYQNPRSKPTDGLQKMLLKEYEYSYEQLQKYMTILMDNLKRGLARETHPQSIVKCYPTFIQDLPTGKEKGKFLAIDLGGTNLRVIMVKLNENQLETVSASFAVPQKKMTGLGMALFDYMAACIHKFLIREKLQNECLPLGFTFSFPLAQISLAKGIIQKWTKGYKCDDVIGFDVCAILQRALRRRGIDKNVQIKAVINDTAGTLMSCAWSSPHCRVGLIIGTGTNACYVEKQKEAEMFTDEDRGSGMVLINCEWGAFGDDGSIDFLRSPEDFIVDQNSINPGKQIHEKMISGMYMGELVRLMILRCASAGVLFGSKTVSREMKQRYLFQAEYISEIESDEPGTFANCHRVMTKMGMKGLVSQDYQNIRFICECVSRRSAHLCAAGLCTLMHKSGEKRITIGIDGSVYRYHPHVHNLMMEKMSQLIKPGIYFDLFLAEDGSGRGAALTAATAVDHRKEDKK